MITSVSSRFNRLSSRKGTRCPLSILRGFSSLQSERISPGNGIVRVPENFVVPVPKPLMVADGNYKGAFTALLAAIIRLTSGIFVSGWHPRAKCHGGWPGTLGLLRDGSSVLSQYFRPTNTLVLYENEADPHSRLVREACSILDLTVEFVPTFKTGAAGVTLSDGDVSLSGSRAIIEHLFKACKFIYRFFLHYPQLIFSFLKFSR